jgi:phenylalanyl-tRNA synthetase beta chain
MAGHEVEGIEQDGAGLEGVVIAEVLEVEKHPDADRLSVCKVSNGSGDILEIVCGAPNVFKGMKTPLAACCVLPSSWVSAKSPMESFRLPAMPLSGKQLPIT